MQVLALFQVAVARGYSELEARSFGKTNFEFPAFGFVLMKEGRQETENGVEVGTDTVTVGYNYNQAIQLEIGKTHVHKHPIDYEQSGWVHNVHCVPLGEREKNEEKKPGTQKKAEATNQEKPIDSEKSRSDKSRKTHRLGKK